MMQTAEQQFHDEGSSGADQRVSGASLADLGVTIISAS